MKVDTGRQFIGRFAKGSDLLSSLTELCGVEQIRLGVFTVIGAVTRACMGYYDQAGQQYVDCVNLEKKLEITCCTGNISLKDGKPFVHAHITLADLSGQACGGHLMPGTVIFAAEYYIRELCGAELQRRHDPQTGLSLW